MQFEYPLNLVMATEAIVQFDLGRLDASLLILTKLPISIHDLKFQGA